MTSQQAGSGLDSSTAVTSGLYHCPGLHGPGCHTDIRPENLSVLLSTVRVELPIFQRKYCWGESQLRRWWADVLRAGVQACGNGKERGSHGVGKIILFTSTEKPPGGDEHTIAPTEPTMVVIDGQQRITTSMLLLAALRDVTRELMDSEAGVEAGEKEKDVARCIYSAVNCSLFCDGGAAAAAAGSLPEVAEGMAPQVMRLIPTYDDRESFYAAVTVGLPGSPASAPGVMDRPVVAGSCQVAARALFMSMIKGRISLPRGGAPPMSLLEMLHFISGAVKNQLTGLTYMHVGTEDSAEHAQQMFQWLQERSILAGFLLFNRAPGVGLTSVDLARNLLLSYFLRSPGLQQELYVKSWLPLQQHITRRAQEEAGGPTGLTDRADQILEAYLLSKGMKVKDIQSPVPNTTFPKSLQVYPAFTEFVQSRLMLRAAEEGEGGSGDADCAQAVVRDIIDDMDLFVRTAASFNVSPAGSKRGRVPPTPGPGRPRVPIFTPQRPATICEDQG